MHINWKGDADMLTDAGLHQAGESDPKSYSTHTQGETAEFLS